MRVDESTFELFWWEGCELMNTSVLREKSVSVFADRGHAEKPKPAIEQPAKEDKHSDSFKTPLTIRIDLLNTPSKTKQHPYHDCSSKKTRELLVI